MKYDFDRIIDRRASDSEKWAIDENLIPMWMADMDFATAPAIIEATKTRASHGVYGYPVVPDAYYTAYIDWWRERHGVTFEREWIIPTIGVIANISTAVRYLTNVAEKIVVQTPMYNIFFNSIINNGRIVLENPLIYDGTHYEIDFEDLEKKLSDPQTSMMMLSNPQNPIGRAYRREELEKIGELCEKYHVIVVSDEIHCDLVDPGEHYVSYSAINETNRNHSVICISPSKAFNIAGLKTGTAVVANPYLRHKLWRGLNTDEVAEPGIFAIQSVISAYTESGEWLDELRAYIAENRRIFTEFVEDQIEGVKVASEWATYLLWVDCTALFPDGKYDTRALADTLKRSGVYVLAGEAYGTGGSGFLRVNIATTRAHLLEGLKRFKTGIENFKKEQENE